MNGIIEKIRTYSAKGTAGIELAEAALIENLGLKGDFYARGGERQISILLSENDESQAEQKEKGLCSLRFKENIRIGEMPPDVLVPGTRLEAGEAVLEISGITKQCHEECILYKTGKRCRLAGLNLFAMVVKGGIIRIGDRINVVQQLFK